MSDTAALAGTPQPLLRRAQRIPLDIVVTATGDRTSGVMVCVLASDLNAYEERLTDLNNLAASVASHYEDRDRGQDVASQEPELHDEAEDLWDRTWPAVHEFDNAADADDRATRSAP